MSSFSNTISIEPVETRKEETFDCIEDYAEPVRHGDGYVENEDKVVKEVEEEDKEHERDEEKENEEEENLVKPDITE